MEQITREELIGLLSRVEAAMEFPYQDPMILQNVRKAKAALQEAEPVAWQFYEDGSWHNGDRKIAGYRRNTEAAGIPVRDLFALPCPPAKTNKEESETVGEKLERQLYTAYLKALDDNQEPLARMIERAITLSAPFRKQPAKAQVPEAGTLKQVIEMVEARSHIRENRMIDGVIFLRDLKAMLTASPAPNNDKDGCTCQGCGIVYVADLIVPDEWWEKIKPEGKAEGSGLLCPTCIMDRLVEKGWSAGHITSPAPDHSGDGNEMVEVPFHKLALGTRFRYTSILESEYVKISATQVARWQDDMAIAGWSGQGVYSFDESDDTNITVLVAATATTCQQEEAER